jgi:hypothetical protein
MARTYRQIAFKRSHRRPATFNVLKTKGVSNEDLAELGLTVQSRVNTRYVPSAWDDLLVSSHREYYPYRRWCRWWWKTSLKYWHLSSPELLARGKCSWVEWYAVYKRTKNNVRHQSPRRPTQRRRL